MFSKQFTWCDVDGAGDDTSDNDVAELREPAVDLSSPDIDDVLTEFNELPTPESLSSMTSWYYDLF